MSRRTSRKPLVSIEQVFYSLVSVYGAGYHLRREMCFGGESRACLRCGKLVRVCFGGDICRGCGALPLFRRIVFAAVIRQYPRVRPVQQSVGDIRGSCAYRFGDDILAYAHVRICEKIQKDFYLCTRSEFKVIVVSNA